MKRTMTAMCVATLCSVALDLSAQTGAMDKGQMDKKAPMTVSGCVAAGKSTGQYMLTNAMMMGGMMGTEKDKMEKDKMKDPAMMSAGHMMSYELVGGSDLRAHLGHKLEVTGTMSKMDMDTMKKMDKMDKMSDQDMKPMRLNVMSVKMTSSICP